MSSTPLASPVVPPTSCAETLQTNGQGPKCVNCAAPYGPKNDTFVFETINLVTQRKRTKGSPTTSSNPNRTPQKRASKGGLRRKGRRRKKLEELRTEEERVYYCGFLCFEEYYQKTSKRKRLLECPHVVKRTRRRHKRGKYTVKNGIAFHLKRPTAWGVFSSEQDGLDTLLNLGALEYDQPIGCECSVCSSVYKPGSEQYIRHKSGRQVLLYCSRACFAHNCLEKIANDSPYIYRSI